MTETRGKDFNYFATITVASSTEDGYFNYGDGYGPYDGYYSYGPIFPSQPQVITGFRGARRMMFVGVTGTNILYSFNGNTVHGRISAGYFFDFGPRAEDKIFFIGSGSVDVHIWHIGV